MAWCCNLYRSVYFLSCLLSLSAAAAGGGAMGGNAAQPVVLHKLTTMFHPNGEDIPVHLEINSRGDLLAQPQFPEGKDVDSVAYVWPVSRNQKATIEAHGTSDVGEPVTYKALEMFEFQGDAYVIAKSASDRRLTPERFVLKLKLRFGRRPSFKEQAHIVLGAFCMSQGVRYAIDSIEGSPTAAAAGMVFGGWLIHSGYSWIMENGVSSLLNTCKVASDVGDPAIRLGNTRLRVAGFERDSKGRIEDVTYMHQDATGAQERSLKKLLAEMNCHRNLTTSEL